MDKTTSKPYTPEQINDARTVLNVLNSVPKQKQYVARLVVEAFILGAGLSGKYDTEQNSA